MGKARVQIVCIAETPQRRRSLLGVTCAHGFRGVFVPTIFQRVLRHGVICGKMLVVEISEGER